MKNFVSKVVSIAVDEIMCIAYDIYSEVKIAVILTIREIAKAMMH